MDPPAAYHHDKAERKEREAPNLSPPLLLQCNIPDEMLSYDIEDVALDAPTTESYNTTKERHAGNEDEEASVSSLALIRKVVRSLGVMPPSVRHQQQEQQQQQSWPHHDLSLSRSYSSYKRKKDQTSPSSLFTDEGKAVFSDSQEMEELDAMSPVSQRDMNKEKAIIFAFDQVIFSSLQQQHCGDVEEGGHLQRHLQQDEQQSPVISGKSPSVIDTESLSSSTSSNRECARDLMLDIEPYVKEIIAASQSPCKRKPRGMSFFQNPKHFRCWGHGKWWTLIALFSACLGSGLAILARNSTKFVYLEKPMNIAPIYESAHAIGMLQFRVCTNSTVTSLPSQCENFDLGAEDINDPVFQVSRILVTISAFWGTLFTLCLMLSTCWESINLKPVGFGLLMVYFAQSFSMLFFDTIICNTHKCEMGPGGVQCISASFCWIITCLATAKMDSHKARLRRHRKRVAKRAAKAAAKAAAEAVALVFDENPYSDATGRLSVPSKKEIDSSV